MVYRCVDLNGDGYEAEAQDAGTRCGHGYSLTRTAAIAKQGLWIVLGEIRDLVKLGCDEQDESRSQL
jgi:hypothetical protein